MEYITNATPYDASLDLEKTITCTNESLNVTYQYSNDKALHKDNTFSNSVLNENHDTVVSVENDQNLFWICPKCKELNDSMAQCGKCGYVRVILT